MVMSVTTALHVLYVIHALWQKKCEPPSNALKHLMLLEGNIGNNVMWMQHTQYRGFNTLLGGSHIFITESAAISDCPIPKLTGRFPVLEWSLRRNLKSNSGQILTMALFISGYLNVVSQFPGSRSFSSDAWGGFRSWVDLGRVCHNVEQKAQNWEICLLLSGNRRSHHPASADVRQVRVQNCCLVIGLSPQGPSPFGSVSHVCALLLAPPLTNSSFQIDRLWLRTWRWPQEWWSFIEKCRSADARGVRPHPSMGEQILQSCSWATN